MAAPRVAMVEKLSHAKLTAVRMEQQHLGRLLLVGFFLLFFAIWLNDPDPGQRAASSLDEEHKLPSTVEKSSDKVVAKTANPPAKQTTEIAPPDPPGVGQPLAAVETQSALPPPSDGTDKLAPAEDGTEEATPTPLPTPAPMPKRPKQG